MQSKRSYKGQVSVPGEGNVAVTEAFCKEDWLPLWRTSSLAEEVPGEKQTAGEGPSLCYSLAVCYKMRMIMPTSLGVGSLKYIYEVAGPGEGEALTDATLTAAFGEGLPREAQGWLFNSTLMIW